MYVPFFGLAQAPFSIAPDPRFLFMSERHREALAHLVYGVQGGGGFVLLSGEIGAGKTTVVRCFLEQIPSDCNVAYIFNPKLTAGELVSEEFTFAFPPTDAFSLELSDNKIQWTATVRIDIPAFPDWSKTQPLQVVPESFLRDLTDAPRITSADSNASLMEIGRAHV